MGVWHNRTWDRQSCFVYLQSSSADELIPKIIRVILPGTTVMSDEWAAYSSLSRRGYYHLTVNHSENFVDLVTGSHTQTIEGFWSNSKVNFNRMHGVKSPEIPAYLDEIMFSSDGTTKQMTP